MTLRIKGSPVDLLVPISKTATTPAVSPAKSMPELLPSESELTLPMVYTEPITSKVVADRA